MHRQFGKRVTIVIIKVKKWRNSLGIPIPQSIAKQLGIDKGSELELTVQGNNMVLKPVDRKPSLEELCSQITEDNKHEEVDWGKPEGKEVW
ncbi:AbrB/MazE/SpoVT family DNA-binding domain-containing protein [Virgibacillus xinjiangensis]|uniref:AbrB/MazE/SpoVT family DNA-binding domain-containing protein n=1 Tax=Virgibacillus xinjiangensis TaxID=393090 RepID=A0ABV7CYV2_9BACI